MTTFSFLRNKTVLAVVFGALVVTYGLYSLTLTLTEGIARYDEKSTGKKQHKSYTRIGPISETLPKQAQLQQQQQQQQQQRHVEQKQLQQFNDQQVLKLAQQMVKGFQHGKRQSNKMTTASIPESPDRIDKLAMLEVLRAHGPDLDVSQLDIEDMHEAEQELMVHKLMDNPDTLCSHKLLMGRLGDGGWEVCDDVTVRPREPCIVYSFGINYDFSFDDAVSKIYGCHVYSFDPSMKESRTHDRSPLVHFHKIGISDKNTTNTKGWRMYTLSGIRHLLGHRKSDIDIVKMDVEFSEWEVLRDAIASGELSDVRQLYIEYHLWGRWKQFIPNVLRTLKQLASLGFKAFLSHKNPVCNGKTETLKTYGAGNSATCYEVHYKRVK